MPPVSVYDVPAKPDSVIDVKLAALSVDCMGSEKENVSVFSPRSTAHEVSWGAVVSGVYRVTETLLIATKEFAIPATSNTKPLPKFK